MTLKPASRLLLALAVLFFLLAALVAGGAFSGGPHWLIPAGLAALAGAFLVP